MSDLPEFPPPMAELRALWEEDCRKLLPDFVLFDAERMEAEISRVAELCGDPSASNIQVITQVLRNLDEDQGLVPEHWWWIAASLVLFPGVVCTPWMEVAWQLAHESRGKREMHTFWGSASSGKSRFFTIIALTNMVIWPGECHVYITSPYKVAGQDKIWGYVKEIADMWAKHPEPWMLELGLQVTANKDEIIITDSESYASSAAFVALESTASIIGKKSRRRPGVPHDPRRGIMLLVGDEVIINPVACANLLTAEGNLIANDNVMSLVGMNPQPHQVRHPSALNLSAPVDRPIDSLSEHKDYTWSTMRGRLLRFCWDTSPNRHAKNYVFHFLINEQQAEAATRRGEDNYRAQVAAWGWSGGMGNGGVLTLEATQTPDWQGTPVWRSERHRWAFFDLAFGGSDPAGYCCLETGTAQMNGADRQVIHGVEHEKLHVQRLWKPTADEVAEFHQRAKRRGGRAPDLVAGRELSGGNAHMVLQMLRVADRLGIPTGRVSFDSSMRMDVTLLAREALGSVPWFYDGQRKLDSEQETWPLWPPENTPAGNPKVWTDCHGRVISAVWRFAEHLIVRGNVTGLKELRKGTTELISRMWVSSARGDKADLEGKKTLTNDRERKMASPMWGETLAMALMFGVRFCGALPVIREEKPLTVGASLEFEKHPVFWKTPRRPGNQLWRVA